MILTVISILEAVLLLSVPILAGFWFRDPTGNFEPILAVFVGVIGIFDLLRRYFRSKKLKVFLSVGATFTKEQEDFVSTFESVLRDSNIERLVVGRDSPPAKQPVLEVKELMKKADAVIVLAFTRYVIISGTEKPNANMPEHKQAKIENVKHPTVWNQIEAGIAFGLNKPLLIFLEDGLRAEAMLKDRLEFMTRTIPLDIAYLRKPEFKGAFSKFTAIARRRSWLKL